MEPVVAHPAVDHRALRHGGLQRRVRIDQRHQRGEAGIGGAGDRDLAVGFRHILHQPVDRVIGVGAIVDIGLVERATQRTGHDIVALRPVQAAHVLIDADIAVIDEIRVHDRQDFLDPLAAVAAGRLARIIGGAGQQDRAVARALAHDDDGEQLHPVAHRDHHFLAHIVRLRPGRIIDIDLVRGHRIGLGGDRRGERSDHQGGSGNLCGTKHGDTPLFFCDHATGPALRKGRTRLSCVRPERARGRDPRSAFPGSTAASRLPQERRGTA